MQRHRVHQGDDGNGSEVVTLDIRTIGGQGVNRLKVKRGSRLRDVLKDKNFNTKAYAFQFKGRMLTKDENGELLENPEITEDALLIITQQRFIHGTDRKM